MRYQSLYYAIAAIGAFLFVNPTAARTLFVADTGDDSNGITWETAFNAISDAVIIAVTNDEIHVKVGTYQENIVLATPINLIGGFLGTEKSRLKDSKGVTKKSVIRPISEGIVVDIASDSSIDSFEISGAFGGPVSGGGNAILTRNATTEITNCDLIFNNGGIGPGLNCISSNVLVRSCTIAHNTAGDEGGGISPAFSQVTLVDCIVANNIAVGSGLPVPQPGLGGGINVVGGRVALINCLFYGNEAEVGSDIHSLAYGGTINSINCIFASNKHPNFRGQFSSSGGGGFVNCIVWGHPTAFIGTPDWKVSYSVFRGGYPGIGNIDADPLFVDPDNGDFHLQEGSPCIDSASTTGPATDLDGNPRPFDVPGVGRDGTGDEFDMGAYEFIPSPTPAPTFLNERSDIVSVR